MKNNCCIKSLIRKAILLLLAILLFCSFIVSVGCSRSKDHSSQIPDNDSTTLSDDPIDHSEKPTDLSFEAFGTITEYSTYSAGEMLSDSFYYKDAWFSDAPEKRNDALALISMQLVAAATEKGENHAAAKAFRLLGFEKVGFVGYETDDPEDCAYTYATKKLGDCTLVAVVVQSYAFDTPTKIKGWKQNFLVNDESASGEHAAFRKAAEKVLDGIASLGGENAKYWIMGHSRGGALANLIAAKLPDQLNQANKGIYAYTFESPATTEADLARNDPAKYAYIHNYLSGDDIVPLIPMWGMVRYGNDYELKSETTELTLSKELQKIGSTASDFEFYSHEETIKALIQYLESRVGSRADYSKINRDVYKDENETVKTIEYSYQETMVHLLESIFSGEFSALSADLLSENMTAFASSVYMLADAVNAEPEGDPMTVTSYYFQAAQGIRGVVNRLIPNGSLSLTDTDFYALLRLIGPKAIDADYEREGDDKYDVAGYIYPVVELAQSAGGLVFSHHFDVVIARLKALAPQPEAQNFEISVSAPKDGDPTALFADIFTAQIEGLDQTWISVDKAGWNVGEQTLTSGSLYYFGAKLKVVGHLVPETFRILINGKAPVEVSSDYENGVCIANLKWEFAIGTPDLVSVSFETGNGAVAPTTLSIEKGKLLKYVEKPVFEDPFSENGQTFLFADWKNESETAWDYIVASENLQLFAKWIRVIDNVQISFVVPNVGDPIPRMTFPEDAAYIASECNVMDEDYFPVEAIEHTGTYNISLFLLAIPGESVFAETLDEFDDPIYDGVILVNGEPWESYAYEFCEDPIILAVYLTFTVS